VHAFLPPPRFLGGGRVLLGLLAVVLASSRSCSIGASSFSVAPSCSVRSSYTAFAAAIPPGGGHRAAATVVLFRRRLGGLLLLLEVLLRLIELSIRGVELLLY
jgi:hypothetical protein